MDDIVSGAGKSRRCRTLEALRPTAHWRDERPINLGHVYFLCQRSQARHKAEGKLEDAGGSRAALYESYVRY